MMQPRSASTHSKINSMMRSSSWSMSSVWLTASAVRYMICRLLRARASQGLRPPSTSTLRISLPSSLAHRADDARAVRRRGRGRRCRSCPARSSGWLSAGPVKSISVPPTCTRSPLAKLARLRQPLAVDERAVRAAQVGDHADRAVVVESRHGGARPRCRAPGSRWRRRGQCPACLLRLRRGPLDPDPDRRTARARSGSQGHKSAGRRGSPPNRDANSARRDPQSLNFMDSLAGMIEFGETPVAIAARDVSCGREHRPSRARPPELNQLDGPVRATNNRV